MSATDSALLSAASFWYAIGEWLVIVGVALEGFEIIRRLASKTRPHSIIEPWYPTSDSKIEPKWVKVIGDCGWFILVIGLVVALKFHFRIADISARENGRLMAELDSTMKSASTNALRVEKLRQKNDALEARVHERTITDVQSNLFIRLMKNYPKIPIKVFVGWEDRETYRYATQIRQLLDAAGYRDNGDGVIRCQHTDINGQTNNAVNFMFYLKPGLVDAPFVYPDKTNGEYGALMPNPKIYPAKVALFSGLPIAFNVSTNDPVAYADGILLYVDMAFSNIGIHGNEIKGNALLKPGEVGIFVNERIQ